ncbi:MAG: hypothetical protein H7644_04095 [Candidatus Heimdallarchaeota archaeon]|nr:hypothetical protein [Candidatus Heimdallarchaeota archaeon]MCK5142925.1 hypothetical protein [Candidatus Heimdallarchaeota archaeon]
MNKKGLILIFLFVVSTVGFVALSNAATDDNKVDVIINYVPSAYVDMGYCWVEFDARFLDDNTVFGENDVISFSFSYDVAIEAWFGAVAPGGGLQTDEWFFEPQNNWTAGYTGTDLYNSTRFTGTMDVILDGYDMGMSNFDVGADGGTYQDIPIQLDIGWHYLTITASELVSDANHTEWSWTYSSDSKRFYVGENKDVIPTLVVAAYFNDVSVTANQVASQDLPSQGYNITDWLDAPRPVAEAVFATQYSIDVEGTNVTQVTTSIEANFNASDSNLNLVANIYGVVIDNIYEMGPMTYMWIVNNGEMDIANDTYEPETLTGLNVGQNYVYFLVYGFAADDIALDYGHAAPRLQVDTAIFNIWIGDLPESTGLGFGILISVSILGLAAALFVRRRK